MAGESIKGAFYEAEIQKVRLPETDSLFEVERAAALEQIFNQNLSTAHVARMYRFCVAFFSKHHDYKQPVTSKMRHLHFHYLTAKSHSILMK